MQITLEQAASLAGLTAASFRQLALQNELTLPSYRDGRRSMFELKDVERFIRAREKQLEGRITKKGGMAALVASYKARIKNYTNLLVEQDHLIDSLVAEVFKRAEVA